jgi:SET domain-containing protein
LSRAKRNGKPPLRVRNSAIQGKGVFATRRIRKGQRIIEYTGEIIDSAEEERRGYDDEAMSRHHTFLFKIDDEYTIDATRRGSMARFINHSCDPNCEAVWEDRRIYIEAIRNIQPGVELCYDYAYEHEGRLTKKDKELYLCRCGSNNCRGTILKPRRKR